MNTMNTKQKTMIGLAVLVIIAIIAIVFFTGNKKTEAPQVAEPVVTETPAPVVKKPASQPVPLSAPAPSQGMSRTDALAKYQDHIVRISDVCIAQQEPQSFVVPIGTTFMIDNDGSKSHTVAVGERTITLKPKTYTLETVSEQSWVSSICNPGSGVTTVTVRVNK